MTSSTLTEKIPLRAIFVVVTKRMLRQYSQMETEARSPNGGNKRGHEMETEARSPNEGNKRGH